MSKIFHKSLTPTLFVKNRNIKSIFNFPDFHSAASTTSLKVNSQIHTSSQSNAKNKVVFLGTPAVSANVLEKLIEISEQDNASFSITSVVTQPKRPKGRGNRYNPVSSPVAETALKHGFVENENILFPPSARDEHFLTYMKQLEPSLCITAAYGNFLPRDFLSIPKYGTLNIHPSLLPKYRGAAPVNRAIKDGNTKTGVSVVYTQLKMDSGPVLATREIDIDLDIQAPELLKQLFEIGTELLIEKLPVIFSGRGMSAAVKQDSALATEAPKMTKEESLLNFQNTALECHNQVRAFVPWPGSEAIFKTYDTLSHKYQDIFLKILKSRIPSEETVESLREKFFGGVCFNDSRMYVQCGGDTILEILEVQKPNSKPVFIRDFQNGLGKKKLILK